MGARVLTLLLLGLLLSACRTTAPGRGVEAEREPGAEPEWARVKDVDLRRMYEWDD